MMFDSSPAAGQRISPRGGRSPRTRSTPPRMRPRYAHGDGAENGFRGTSIGEGENGLANGSDVDRRPRAHSPTFKTSENWMGYSADNAAETTGSPRRLRLQSGRMTENSESWGSMGLRPGLFIHRQVGTDAPGHTATTPGKKTNYARNQDALKRRLMQDESQAATEQSHRRHGFMTTHGQATEREGGSRGSRAPVVDGHFQHRTSPDMAASFRHTETIGGHESDFSATADGAYVKSSEGVPRASSPSSTYFVGDHLLSWQSHGRRGPMKCFQHSTPSQQRQQSPPPQPQQLPTPCGYAPSGASSCAPGIVELRDHRNSDAIREHLQQAKQVDDAPRIYSYGFVSSLPSTMPKDTAYLTSGLRIVRSGARMPGAFSPHASRVATAKAQPHMPGAVAVVRA